MRYAQGGGLTDERRFFREKLRMEAAERFVRGDENTVIAHDLRVRVRSVQRWRRAWSQSGSRALASKGPVAHGWPDQTWTLSRIKTLIGRRFHKSYTVQGAAALLKRHGWSCQVPARRAIERDENVVAGWVKETWPQVEGPWRRSMPGSSSRTRQASR
ncbi:winged helix-turn-helix domain-containing protein [Streptomyces sp. NPDC013433]|uniref:winged helix-turn-helix domain-containing protein n=1 Tax=Streptomyces sp. NPDC013433 TaxID=3155604 RepID=UPI0034533BC9